MPSPLLARRYRDTTEKIIDAYASISRRRWAARREKFLVEVDRIIMAGPSGDEEALVEELVQWIGGQDELYRTIGTQWWRDRQKQDQDA